MSAQQATATGTLGATPILNLLVYALARKLTGTLVVEDHRYLKSAILFGEGAPSKVKSAEMVGSLGDILVERGIIDEPTKERTLREASQQKILHGQVLVSQGLCDKAQLVDALAEQVGRKIEWLASLRPESVYGYYDRANYLERWAGPTGVPVDPLRVIWRVVRAHADAHVIEQTLARLGGRELRLHVNSRILRFGFDERERGVLDVLRARPLALSRLAETGLVPEASLKKVLYALVVTRHLDVGDPNSQPLGVEDGMVMGAPRHPSPSPAVSGFPTPGPSIGPRAPSSPAAPAWPTPIPHSGEGRVSPVPSGRPSPPGPSPYPSPVPSGRPSTPGPAAYPSPVPSGRPSASSMPPVRPSPLPTARPSAPGPSGPPDRASAVPALKSDGPPRPSLPADVIAFKEEIRNRAESVGRQNYYQILGLESTAPGAAIQAAFFKLAKKWHPDRLGPEYDDVREAANRVFSRMSEAHQVLASDEQRREYDKLMKEGGGTPDEQEKVQRVLRAAMAFQKAEVLLRKGSLEEAEVEARRANDDDPEQAEYIALYADILSRKLERVKNASFEEVVKMVNKARKMQPDNIRVRLIRARVLKRAGDEEGALKEFRRVVSVQPHNVEAARELRLHELRKTDKKSGLSKFFKR